MSLKQDFLNKTPPQRQNEPHFVALLEHIKRHNIQSKGHLVDFLKKEINLLEKSLESTKHAGPTGVKSTRDKAVHLNLLKKCYQLTQEFLG